MAKEILSWCELRWDSNGPLGALDAEEVGCPGRVGRRVVGELVDFDPDVTGVAFEHFAVIVGAVGEVAVCGWIRFILVWCLVWVSRNGEGTHVMTGPLWLLPHWSQIIVLGRISRVTFLECGRVRYVHFVSCFEFDDALCWKIPTCSAAR